MGSVNDLENCALCSARNPVRMVSWAGNGMICGACAKDEEAASIIFEGLTSIVEDAIRYTGQTNRSAATLIGKVLRSPAFREGLKDGAS